jgi:hypothetical protein
MEIAVQLVQMVSFGTHRPILALVLKAPNGTDYHVSQYQLVPGEDSTIRITVNARVLPDQIGMEIAVQLVQMVKHGISKQIHVLVAKELNGMDSPASIFPLVPEADSLIHNRIHAYAKMVSIGTVITVSHVLMDKYGIPKQIHADVQQAKTGMVTPVFLVLMGKSGLLKSIPALVLKVLNGTDTPV